MSCDNAKCLALRAADFLGFVFEKVGNPDIECERQTPDIVERYGARTSRALPPPNERRGETEGEDVRQDSLLVELESILNRMDPIGRAIIAAPPATFNARRYRRDTLRSGSLPTWSEPIERIGLQKKAVRLLIGHVC